METKKILLLIAIVILFIIGAWPIAIVLLILYFINPTSPKQQTYEDLEKENEALRQELADQAVRHAMDKAENREKKD